MKSVILVVTKDCPFCPSVDKLWTRLKKKYNFDYKLLDATSDEGSKLVEKFGIMSVPATIIDDKLKFIGVPDKSKAEEALK